MGKVRRGHYTVDVDVETCDTCCQSYPTLYSLSLKTLTNKEYGERGGGEDTWGTWTEN